MHKRKPRRRQHLEAGGLGTSVTLRLEGRLMRKSHINKITISLVKILKTYKGVLTRRAVPAQQVYPGGRVERRLRENLPQKMSSSGHYPNFQNLLSLMNGSSPPPFRAEKPERKHFYCGRCLIDKPFCCNREVGRINILPRCVRGEIRRARAPTFG